MKNSPLGASPAIGPSHRLEAICPSPSGEEGEKASRADSVTNLNDKEQS